MDEMIWTLIALLAASTFGNLYHLGSKIDSLGARLDSRIDGVDARLDAVNARLDDMNGRLAAHIAPHTS